MLRVRIHALLFAAVPSLLAPAAWAETFTVLPGDDYTKLENAAPGDIVEIAPGTYPFRVFLSATGTADMPIIIRAADPANRPVFDLGGQNVEDWPGSYTGGDNGRGCWQVGGAHYQISGIVFRNCHTAGGNAPGIRARDAQALTVRDCLFEDSDVGFSGSGEEVTIEFSELAGNGQVSNPPQHNIYIFGGSFRLRYSYVHDSVGGQNLHIRARDAIIEHNWIARAANYEGDIMTGDDPTHTMLLRGNVIVGNDSPGNGSTMWTLFNDTGDPNVSMHLTMVHNTVYLPAGGSAAIASIRNDTLSSASVTMHNNIFVGAGEAYRINDGGNPNVTIAGTNNWLDEASDPGLLTGTITGADPGLSDPAGLDFTLATASPAIGAADTSAPFTPDREYFENEGNPMMFRWRLTASDLGALESTTAGDSYGPYDDPGEPPPTGSGGGGASGGAGGSSPSSSASSGAGGNDAGGADGGGCSCHTAPARKHGGFALIVVAALALVTRRRQGL